MSEELAAAVLAGDRAALARAITLAESTRADHRQRADEILTHVLPSTGTATRIGISGTPGVGKSTFIERLGLHLIEDGKRVAVLAVDPSSQISGGSILGDKTRMVELGRSEASFIRASPSGGLLGGVAEATRDVLLLCEAAGYDVVLVETVGVGQSETAVSGLTDLFLLLVAPGGGDDLQGIKRGVLELADVIAINKADGRNKDAAAQTASDYRSALHLVRPKWGEHQTEVLTCSALQDEGIARVWGAIAELWHTLAERGELEAQRRRQAVDGMWRIVDLRLRERVRSDPTLAQAANALVERVNRGVLPARAAASEMLSHLRVDESDWCG